MSKSCDPEEVALKSFFLGPQSENAIWLQSSLSDLLVRWFEWRQGRNMEDGRAISATDQASAAFKKQRKHMADVLDDLAARFEGEVPRYSPRYAGHMCSEVALPAMLGHVAALLHNPNIISGESARIGVLVEDEAIEALLRMVGYNPGHATGHFTSGGTVANFEAVVRARARAALWMAAGAALAELQGAKPDPCRDAMMGWAEFDRRMDAARALAPDWQQRVDGWNFEKTGFHGFARRLYRVFEVDTEHPVMLVPGHKHYSWTKAASLFGFGDGTMRLARLDAQGCLDTTHLRECLSQALEEKHPVMLVVSAAGTTELGALDPIGKVAEAVRSFGSVWHHVDAAYGGFFATLNHTADPELAESFLEAVQAFSQSDSLTIDPHKLGYVPYSAGCFMVAQRRDYDLRAIVAPYIQYTGVDRGPMTIEGSRPATGAAATWMVAKTIGLDPDGFGRILSRNFQARRELECELKKIKFPARVVETTDSNVLCFVAAQNGEALSVVNARTRDLHHNLSQSASRFIVSKTTLDWRNYEALCERFAGSWGAVCDAREIVLIRMCLMNPFFTSKETSVPYPEALAREIESLLVNPLENPG
jgi:glutamate/tyrosine decarboxylase-like PLP-dependent enzyme